MEEGSNSSQSAEVHRDPKVAAEAEVAEEIAREAKAPVEVEVEVEVEDLAADLVL